MRMERMLSVRSVKGKERTLLLIEKLTAVWEDSVRATHLFLSESEIENIRNYVPGAIEQVPNLIVAENGEKQPVAFMGTGEEILEMLFLSPEERGRGLGRRLVQCAILHYGVREVAVNEQNPQAAGFYEHMGFQIYKRTELDEQGNPYPLLYMRLG